MPLFWNESKYTKNLEDTLSVPFFELTWPRSRDFRPPKTLRTSLQPPLYSSLDSSNIKLFLAIMKQFRCVEVIKKLRR